MAETEEKVCRTCRETKPLDQFGPLKRNRDGHRGTCRKCDSEREMRRRDANPDLALNSHLKRKYGITLEEYRELVVQQEGLCAICGEPPLIPMGLKSRRQGRMIHVRLVVDHDHATGRVRGLLCGPCNRGIGFLRDDPATVAAALRYLEREA